MIGDRLLRVAHHAFVVFLVVASAIVLTAQTVVDPRSWSSHLQLITTRSPRTARRSSAVLPLRLRRRVLGGVRHHGPRQAGAERRRHPRRVSPLRHSAPTPGRDVRGARHGDWSGGSTASSASNGFSFRRPCAIPQLDWPVGWCRRHDGERGRDGRHRLHLVRGFERGLDHADRCDQRKRHGRAVQRGGQPEDVGANRNPDGRWTDLHRESGGPSCTYTLSPRACRCGRRRHRIDERDGACRVCVDGRQQQHVVDDGDERGERQRATARSLSRSANPNTTPRTGTLTIGGPDVHRDSGGRACTLRARRRASGCGRRRHRIDERDGGWPGVHGRLSATTRRG